MLHVSYSALVIVAVDPATSRRALKYTDRLGMNRFLMNFGAGEELELMLQPATAQRIRSRRANAYYWSVVLKMAAEHTGHSEDDIHDAMCERFLPSERKHIEFYNHLTGEGLTVETEVRRSSNKSPKVFYEFVENVRMFLADFLGIITPDPDPNYWRKRRVTV